VVQVAKMLPSKISFACANTEGLLKTTLMTALQLHLNLRALAYLVHPGMVQLAKMLALERNFVCMCHGGTVKDDTGDYCPKIGIKSPCFSLPCAGNASTTCQELTL
jgi:hypothetical protein